MNTTKNHGMSGLNFGMKGYRATQRKLRSWEHDGERRLTATEVLMKERDARWG